MTKPLLTGVLKTWKEDRGFGFITPDNGSRDVFIHISALGDVARRPVPGDVIHYKLVRDRNGKYRAVNASIDGVSTTVKVDVTKTENLGFKWIIAAAVVLLVTVSGVAFVYFRSRGNV